MLRGGLRLNLKQREPLVLSPTRWQALSPDAPIVPVDPRARRAGGPSRPVSEAPCGGRPQLKIDRLIWLIRGPAHVILLVPVILLRIQPSG